MRKFDKFRKERISVMEKILPTIDKITNATEKTAQATVAFLKKETPELVREVIRWGVINTISWFVVGVTLTVIGAIRFNSLQFFSKTFYLQIIPITFLIFGIVIMFNSTDWVKPMFTPRLYLLEWVKKQIKG